MNVRGFSQLLLLLVIIIAFVIIAFAVPTIKSKINIRITWKRSFILAGIYLGVLILLVPMLYVLPSKGFIVPASDKDMNIAEKLSQDAIDHLNNHLPLVGELEKQKGLYTNSSHTFKIETNKMAFMGSDINNNNQIFVERKDVDDGEVEVYSYVATHSANNIDFTKLVLPPVISYKNGTLTINPANQQKLEFNYFSSDFTVAQFNILSRGSGTRSMSAGFGWELLYIRVPKSLELDKGNLNQIQMISRP